MKIRKYEAKDEARVRELHASSGFDYPLPDFSSSEFAEVLVVADDEDRLVQLVAARKVTEVYFVGDPQWRTPRWRLDALLGIHQRMQETLQAMGYRDVVAFLPPQIAKSFGRRLKGMGWIAGRWRHFSKYFGEA